MPDDKTELLLCNELLLGSEQLPDTKTFVEMDVSVEVARNLVSVEK